MSSLCQKFHKFYSINFTFSKLLHICYYYLNDFLGNFYRWIFIYKKDNSINGISNNDQVFHVMKFY